MTANELLEKVRELLPRLNWTEIDEGLADGPACAGAAGDEFVWVFVSEPGGLGVFEVEATVTLEGRDRDQVVEDWLEGLLPATPLHAEQDDLGEAIAEVRTFVLDLNGGFDKRPPEPF